MFVEAIAAAAVGLPAYGAPEAGWVAFIAPDIPQTRALFAELENRSSPELRAHSVGLRFVALGEGSDAEGRALVARTVAARPRVILATATRTALWAKEATDSIPILFASVADPVRAGLVDSLARPGRNLTGFTYDIPVEGKQFELLRELAPGALRLGVLEDGSWLGERITEEQLATYERVLKGTIRVFRAESAEELAKIVTGERGRQVDAWLVPISNTAAQGRAILVAAFAQARKPAVFGRSFFVDAGGLAACQEIVDAPMEIWRDMLRDVLRGAPPGQIPVQRPRRFEMTINLVVANRLGLRLPLSLLRRADRVTAHE